MILTYSLLLNVKTKQITGVVVEGSEGAGWWSTRKTLSTPACRKSMDKLGSIRFSFEVSKELAIAICEQLGFTSEENWKLEFVTRYVMGHVAISKWLEGHNGFSPKELVTYHDIVFVPGSYSTKEISQSRLLTWIIEWEDQYTRSVKLKC